MATANTGARGVRSDAQRNHELLVAAAREVFTECGVEARLDEIARRAGVGIGTLYRHFPSREALVEELFAERVGEFLAVARAALLEADAWLGLTRLLETTLELQSGDRIVKEIFLRYPPGEGVLEASRQQIRVAFEQILARAHEHGVLRPDFGLPDLMLLLWSFAPVIDATSTSAPAAWRRHLHWLLDGLRADHATPQVEAPLDEGQLAEAMSCLRQQRFPRKPGRARRDES
jgi:AcrR family transcriptional regulator